MDNHDPAGDTAGQVNNGGEAASLVARSQDLRASLEAVISEAERASEQLVAQSRASAETTTREADERAAEILDQARAAADVIRTRAESDVEEHRRRVRTEVAQTVRAELAEQNRLELAAVRAQSQAVIGDLEATVRILGVSMESAVANITEMLSALEQLRSHTADPMPQPRPAAETPLEPTPAPRLQANYEHHDEAQHVAQVESGDELVQPRPEPVGDALDGPVDGSDAEPSPAPMTATEAFQSASSFEDDPVDRVEPTVVTNLRDEHALSEREREQATADPAADEAAAAAGADENQAKPLGWLFRSPD